MMVRRFIPIKTFVIVVGLMDKIMKLVRFAIAEITLICTAECIHKFHKFNIHYSYLELLLIRLRDQSQSQIYFVIAISQEIMYESKRISIPILSWNCYQWKKQISYVKQVFVRIFCSFLLLFFLAFFFLYSAYKLMRINQ